MINILFKIILITMHKKYINDIFIHLRETFVMSIFIVQILLHIKFFDKKTQYIYSWGSLL